MGRYTVWQHKAQGVEVLVIHLFVSQFIDTLFQICSDAVDTFCNGVNTFRTVVHLSLIHIFISVALMYNTANVDDAKEKSKEERL